MIFSIVCDVIRKDFLEQTHSWLFGVVVMTPD